MTQDIKSTAVHGQQEGKEEEKGEEHLEKKEKAAYKLAIVGGGISGLYAALQLITNKTYRADEIVLLEKRGTLGGRLDTDIVHIGDVPGKPTIKEEQGAMRFTKQNMPYLSSLINAVKMQKAVVPFLMAPDPGKPNNNNRYYRSRYFTDWYATQNPNVWSQMFSLDSHEWFKSAGDIVRDIYRKLLDRNRSKVYARFPDRASVILAQEDREKLQIYQDPEYWSFFRNAFTWPVGMQDTLLRDFSMQALLAEMGYSHGCCMMLVETQGFLSVSLSAGNVGVILQDLITFDMIWDNLWQFKNGWTSLVKRIANKISGVRILLHHEVNKITEHGHGSELFELCAMNKGTSASPPSKVTAERVILAVPGVALQQLYPTWLEGQPGNLQIMENICNSIVGIRCTKINLYFDSDWWNEHLDEKLYGPSITSLPCGFIYPFYGRCTCGLEGFCECSPIRGKEEECGSCVAALTIYCDVNNAQFWSSLQLLGHKFSSPLQAEKRHDNLTPASEPVVTEAIRQLKKVFNRGEIPMPILTSYRSWDGKERVTKSNSTGEEGYGCAIHMWGLMVDDQKLETSQPIKGRNLYLCNEAWSDYQGWVEGSLRHTDKTVKLITKQMQTANTDSS